MSRISDAILETLLEEITDYSSVELSKKELNDLQDVCDQWEDRNSIETEINIFLYKAGYNFDDDECMFLKN